jgi:CheY-like chemotaxis protein
MVVSDKIALIEDNLDDAELTKIAFETVNIYNKLLYFNGGKEAISYFSKIEQIDHLPFIILLDLKMPLIGGYDVIRMLKSKLETEKIPVVIVTSSIEPEDKMKCLELGAAGFLLKPLTGNKIVSVLTELNLLHHISNRS